MAVSMELQSVSLAKRRVHIRLFPVLHPPQNARDQPLTSSPQLKPGDSYREGLT